MNYSIKIQIVLAEICAVLYKKIYSPENEKEFSIKEYEAFQSRFDFLIENYDKFSVAHLEYNYLVKEIGTKLKEIFNSFDRKKRFFIDVYSMNYSIFRNELNNVSDLFLKLNTYPVFERVNFSFKSFKK